MAACGSIHHIFEKPAPENPTLIQSLSPWNQINRPPINQNRASFTEIFGELHFQERDNYDEQASSSSPPLNFLGDSNVENSAWSPDPLFPSFRSHSPTMTSESLQLCTEGLGSESFDAIANEAVKDGLGTPASEEEGQKEAANPKKSHSPPWSGHNHYREFRRSKSYGGAFPPPISTLGKTGKPWVSFKSFRYDGRFVLKEIRIPTREFLHASRENGRLKLQLVQPEEEEDEEGNEHGNC